MENLRFDFEGGRIFRLNKKYNTYELSGNKREDGYIRLSINNKLLYLHRFLYEQYHNTKLTKEKEIDHINGIRDDNRICNLRIANRSQNNQNRNINKNKKLNIKGVCWDKHNNKYKSCCKFNNKNIHIGHFDNVEDAKIAYDNKIKELNEKFGCYFKVL